MHAMRARICYGAVDKAVVVMKVKVKGMAEIREKDGGI
jgi:hypothetical protein